MGKAGRPRLLQKEGFHRHDGYDRLHPLYQIHRPDLHAEFDITDAPQLIIKDNVAGEVHDLISKLEYLEKHDEGILLLEEVQKSIHALLQARRERMKRKGKMSNQESHPELQVALGDNVTEIREPNTIGLP